MKKKMLKQQIKSVIYSVVLGSCVAAPILFCDALFDNTRNYLVLLGFCLAVGCMAFDGFVNAERKLYLMRKRAVELKSAANVQNERVA